MPSDEEYIGQDGNSKLWPFSLDRSYAGGVDNANWQFLKSRPYLEQLGALDNADPQHMSVIISNYVNSPSNCVASSKFYSVCWVEKCGSLISTLEGRIAAPKASPSLLAQLIAGLPSDTVSAPRTLPDSLVQRLNEIASHHGEEVPLHGRLFDCECTMRTLVNVHTRISQAQRTQSPMRRTWTKLAAAKNLKAAGCSAKNLVDAGCSAKDLSVPVTAERLKALVVFLLTVSMRVAWTTPTGSF